MNEVERSVNTVVVWSVNPQVHVIVHNAELADAKRLVTDSGYSALPNRATVVRDIVPTSDVVWMEIVSAYSHEEAIGWVMKENASV